MVSARSRVCHGGEGAWLWSPGATILTSTSTRHCQEWAVVFDSSATQASGLLPSLLSEHQQQKPYHPTCVSTSECVSPLPWSSWSQDLNSHLTKNITTTPRPSPLQWNLAVLSAEVCIPVSHMLYFSRPMRPGMQQGHGKRPLCEQLSKGEPALGSVTRTPPPHC